MNLCSYFVFANGHSATCSKAKFLDSVYEYMTSKYYEKYYQQYGIRINTSFSKKVVSTMKIDDKVVNNAVSACSQTCRSSNNIDMCIQEVAEHIVALTNTDINVSTCESLDR